MDPWVGRVIDARYRVLGRLGRGGMGVVYRVEHQRMGKIAAMKVLHRELASNREVVKRFCREAEAVSRLTHPNTVQMFDFGTVDGACYLVMEYVRGEDLATILERDGPLPFARVAPLIAQVCGALAEAHELGIIHRDLKPENIVVTRARGGRDHAKVLDFGLAKLSGREEPTDATGDQVIVGTPHYMAPEQIRGEEPDPRSDVYSLGAVLYRLLTDEPAFDAKTPVGVLTKSLTDPLVPPSARRPDLGIDPRVDAIVVRAMARGRDRRYATVDAMREEVESTARELEAWGRPTPSPGGVPPAAGASDDASGRVFVPASGSALTGAERRRPDDDPRMAARLVREDVDAFERSLRRRALILRVAVPLFLAMAGGALWGFLRWRRHHPHGLELEPNETSAQATPIAPGKPVRGYISRRDADAPPDRDYFALRVPEGAAPRRLRARLDPVRNLDLALIVYDATGAFLMDVDNAGVGEPEVLPAYGVAPSAGLLLAVQESQGAATRAHGPTENTTDPYTLTVDLGDFAPGDEIEPNNTDSDAGGFAPGRPARGTLGRLRDEDRFRFEGPEGLHELEVAGGGAATVRLRVGGGSPAAGRKLQVRLTPGTIVAVERDDRERDRDGRIVARDLEVEYELQARPIPGSARSQP